MVCQGLARMIYSVLQATVIFFQLAYPAKQARFGEEQNILPLRCDTEQSISTLQCLFFL
jgi:hypothetical protein